MTYATSLGIKKCSIFKKIVSKLRVADAFINSLHDLHAILTEVAINVGNLISELLKTLAY